jgi:hypothetical protein
MKPFPWGLLTLVLLGIELVFTPPYLLRKRLARWLCRKALAKGKRSQVDCFLDLARTQRLIKPAEESAWRKEFGLEQ